MTRSRKYDPVAMTLHWTVAALVVVMLVFGGMPEGLPTERRAVEIRLHSGLGLTVLVLMIVRWIWRLTHPPPPLPEAVPRVQRALARFVHLALYALVLLQPLLGVALAASVDYPVHAFGVLEVSALSAADRDRAELLLGLHSLNATALSVLIAGHVGMALVHGLRGDRVVKRMLPFGG